MKRSDVEVALESPSIFKSKIEHSFFSQVIFHVLKKDSILLSSDYVQLSKETFVQCTGVFCNKEADYQQLSRSIYRDEERFRCHNMTLNSIHKMFDVTLHQKLAKSNGFIHFEARFKYLKYSPPKNYGKIVESDELSLHSCLVNYSYP